MLTRPSAVRLWELADWLCARFAGPIRCCRSLFSRRAASPRPRRNSRGGMLPGVGAGVAS